MRALAPSVAFAAALFVSSSCSSPSKDSQWRIADEGSFTVEIPTWLHKQEIQAIDSHCGVYRSRQVYLSFDEVGGPMYTAEMAKVRHEEFTRAYKTTQDENNAEFIKRIGDTYARFTLSQDKGDHTIRAFIPNLRGSYLSLFVKYRDPAYAETALRIAKSVTRKG